MYEGDQSGVWCLVCLFPSLTCKCNLCGRQYPGVNMRLYGGVVARDYLWYSIQPDYTGLGLVSITIIISGTPYNQIIQAWGVVSIVINPSERSEEGLY